MAAMIECDLCGTEYPQVACHYRCPECDSKSESEQFGFPWWSDDGE